MPGQAKRTKEFALLKSVTQRLAQASSFTPLLCWGRPAPRFSLISTLPLRPKDGEPLSLGTQLPSAQLYRDHEFAKNGRGVFSLDDWSGSISRCVFLLNLLVLKAPVSRGMATLVVLVPSHGHPCLGDAEKQEFQMRQQLSAGPSEGQEVARAGGVRNVQKEQGPRGQDKRKAEKQRKRTLIWGDGRSCGQFEGARRSRSCLFPSQKVDE